ncbi:MAG: type II secretion system protein J [SAR324 cluster bacterium]
MAMCANSISGALPAPRTAASPYPFSTTWRRGAQVWKCGDSSLTRWKGIAASGARGRTPGFTLLEVLIALAILSLCLVAIYQGYASTLAISTSTQKLWKAMEYSHNELARWERMNPAPDVSVNQGEFPPADPMAGYSWKREITDLEPLPSIKVRRIRLELFWTLGQISQSYRSSIYVLPTSASSKTGK